MRLATIVEDERLSAAVVEGRRVLPLAVPGTGLDSVRAIAAGGEAGLRRVGEWVLGQPARAYRALDDVVLGPAVPDPGAIYTIGLNYAAPGEAPPSGTEPERPLVYGKLPSSVTGHGAPVAWDRTLTSNVDAEVELAVVIGAGRAGTADDRPLERVFGYTCVNDISSRDPWLDGDQWLLGKSMAGFCPVGPWVVTADELDPADLRLGCTVNGVAQQEDRTSRMRHPIGALIAYLGRHVELRPGDLLVTGTPARLAAPPGPDRHLQPGDVVTVWIEGIGQLTNPIG
ncbi:MAG TPA: fumarylacetoacetate hydrolase family protein [Candidatus Sulfotelmatobacter sp.]|nr:fumarylacetoacetate hydrolase family protein [Candidatus Sulfotelmatobacter sp.]